MIYSRVPLTHGARVQVIERGIMILIGDSVVAVGPGRRRFSGVFLGRTDIEQDEYPEHNDFYLLVGDRVRKFSLGYYSINSACEIGANCEDFIERL